ncbi:MAG: hypothetical protein GWP19_00220 [Planctomycetia bacterium]|nr:hypothetical protein [Planctomycetia bacterium]
MGAIFSKDNIYNETRRDVSEQIDKSRDQIGAGAYNFGAVVQDTARGGMRLVDNSRSDLLYTVRDLKHEGFTMVDSAIDNGAQIIDRQVTNVINTVQGATLLGVGVSVIFLVLYGEKLFEHGIRLGKINFF